MTNTKTQVINENLKQIKEEGGVRSQKIGQIFQTAFGEVATELKEGTTIIRPLAQALAGEAIYVAKEKGQAVNTNVRQALKETSVEDTDLVERLTVQIQAIIKAIREALFVNHTPEEMESAPLLQKEIAQPSNNVVTLDAMADAA